MRSGLAGLLVLVLGLLLVGRALEQAHQPRQNWLPQGSFRPGPGGGPDGWSVSGVARVEHERATSSAPLGFLRLEPGAAAWTELALEPGWDHLRVRVWSRSKGGVASLEGLFLDGERGLSQARLELPPAHGQGWNLSQGSLEIPAGADRLQVRVACAPAGERLELAELSLAPQRRSGR